MKVLQPVLLIVLLFSSSFSLAQRLDSLWGEGGRVSQQMGGGAENTLFSQAISEDRFVVIGANYRKRDTERYFFDYDRLDIWLTCFDKGGNQVDTFGKNGVSIIPVKGHSQSARIDQAVVDKHGRVLIIGIADFNIFLCRILPSGDLDYAFGDHGFFNLKDSTLVNHAEIQIGPQGNIFVFSNNWFSANQFFLLALNENGQKRKDWGNDGVLTYHRDDHFSSDTSFRAANFSVLHNGRFWVGGTIWGDTLGAHFILQINEKGAIDKNFGENGLKVITEIPRLFFIQNLWPISEDTILISCALDTDDPLGFKTGGILALDEMGSLISGFGDSGLLAPPPEFPVRLNAPRGLIRIDNNNFAAILNTFIFKFERQGKTDHTFGYKGFQKWKLEGRSTSVQGLFPLRDSSLFFVGKTGAHNYIGKLKADGSLDPAFHEVGFQKYLIKEGGSLAQVINTDAQGRIWTAGPGWQTITTDSGRVHSPFQFISQYTSSGEHIKTLKAEQSSRSHVDLFDLVHLKNGRTLTVGAYDKTSLYAFLRAYQADGTADNSFGEGSFATLRLGRPYGVLELPNGQLYVSGRFQINTFLKAPSLICLDEDGLRKPTTFGLDRIAYRAMEAQSIQLTPEIHLDSAQRIYVGGTADNDFFLLRFLPNGDPDSSFGSAGLSMLELPPAAENSCMATLLQADHRTVILGTSDHYFALKRADEHGEIDFSFGKNGEQYTSHPEGALTAYTACEMPDGNILMGGKIRYSSHEDEDFALACYDPNGNPDPGFGEKGILLLDFGGHDEAILDIDIQSDSSILLAGHSDDRMLVVKLLSKLEMASPASPGPETNSLLVFPNPLQKEATLRYSLDNDQEIRIQLLRITGQQVVTLINGYRRAGAHEESLRIPQGLAPGWYLLVLEAEGGRSVVKVMVGG